MKRLLISAENFRFDEYDKCLSLMSEQRRRQVLEISHPLTRKMTVFGEWTVKNTLAEISNKNLEEITLARTAKGKPYAEDCDIHFSISHSGELLAAVFSSSPIGIDLEIIRPIDLTVTKKACTEQEVDYIFGSEKDKLLRFFEVWTAKEAYFKKTGSGITDLKKLNYFELSPLHFYEQGSVITVIK